MPTVVALQRSAVGTDTSTTTLANTMRLQTKIDTHETHFFVQPLLPQTEIQLWETEEGDGDEPDDEQDEDDQMMMMMRRRRRRMKVVTTKTMTMTMRMRMRMRMTMRMMRRRRMTMKMTMTMMMLMVKQLLYGGCFPVNPSKVAQLNCPRLASVWLRLSPSHLEGLFENIEMSDLNPIF